MSELTDLEAQILFRLKVSPAMGHHLRAELRVDGAVFDRASQHLWRLFALRGQVEDGCCNDQCGANCIVAFNHKRTWSLTDAGRTMKQGLAKIDLASEL